MLKSGVFEKIHYVGWGVTALRGSPRQLFGGSRLRKRAAAL
jgi:hypothetical protein